MSASLPFYGCPRRPTADLGCPSLSIVVLKYPVKEPEALSGLNLEITGQIPAHVATEGIGEEETDEDADDERADGRKLAPEVRQDLREQHRVG